MMKNEEIQKPSQDLKTGKVVVFRRRLDPEHNTDSKILSAFHELIKRQPQGAWLIRESRSVGMISVTVHAESGAKDYRFGFSGEGWVNLRTPGVGALQYIDKNNIADKFLSFMAYILQHLSLDEQKLCLPAPEYSSTEDSYSNYIIHDNPLPHLKSISERLRQIKNNLQNDVSTEDEQLLIRKLLKIAPNSIKDELFESFEGWLEKTGLLIPELKCPITKELFKFPYLLVDSSWIYEESALVELKKLNRLSQCPATGIEIKETPRLLTAYTEELKKRSLPLFQEAVELCHLKKKTGFFKSHASFFSGKAKEPTKVQFNVESNVIPNDSEGSPDSLESRKFF